LKEHPLPLNIILDARQDTIHQKVGKVKPAKMAKVMKKRHCPDCDKLIFFSDGDCLCTDCRVKAGMPPYDFISVDIQPWIKDVEQFEILTGKDFSYIECFTPIHNGFSITWVARGYGFSTTEFWEEEDGWHMEPEPYPEGFLVEAMKFFFSKLQKGEGYGESDCAEETQTKEKENDNSDI
jgi:hypothetical protein